MPPSIDGVTFHSHGSRLVGTFWLTDTVGRHPTVLLLHGISGVEKQTDLAYALRNAGWNCLIFHYRGCWGSEGNYSPPGIVDDITAAVDFLAAHPRVDPERLASVGLSLGGWGLVTTAAHDPRLRALVIMNPLVDGRTRPLEAATASEWAGMLNGIAPRDLQEQWLALPASQLVAPQLAGRPTLLVTADADDFFPQTHFEPLAQAMPFAERRRIPEANHVFSAHRSVAVQTVLDWLNQTFSKIPSLPQGYTLRSPVEEDHARVLAVLSDWWGGRDLSHLLPRLYFQHFNNTSFIVEVQGQLVGFLIGFLSQSEPSNAYIHFVGVHPEHRKQHLGQALYERFFALARARGAHAVRAITGTVNTGSQAFHTRLGFKVSEPIPDYDGPGDDRVTMKKTL